MNVANKAMCYYTPAPRANDMARAAGEVAKQTQTEQDKLTQLYALTNAPSSTNVNEELNKLGFKGVADTTKLEAHLRQLINTQQQKVNRSFENLTAFQTFMKNIHEMIMAMIRNMRLQP